MLKLRTKLLLAYLSALIPLAIGFGWWAFVVASNGLDAELGRTLSGIADGIAADFSYGGTAGRIARMTPESASVRGGLEARLTAIRDRTGVERIRVISPDLETLVDTSPSEPFARSFDLERDTFEIDRALESFGAQHSLLFFDDAGTGYKVGYGVVTMDGAPVALVAVEGSASYFALLRSFRTQVMLFGLGVLLLIVVVSIVMSRRITAPLSALSDVARDIGSGDLRAEVPPGSDDEIGDLANALRQMRGDLLARDEETQMMLAGIAHEIRNPLGGMELFVGLLEDSLDSASEDAAHAAKVRRELNYLTRVVEEFLQFARDRPLESTRCDARVFVDEVVANATRAAERGVVLTTDVPEGCELSGDMPALRGVLINLVQNAAQASDAGDPVTIGVQCSGDRRRITVSDSGSGMSAEVLSNIMRPFYTTREKGTGLGLPLAKKVVERHHGSLEVDSTPGGGTTVVLVIPFDSTATESSESSGIIGLDDGDWDGEMIG